MNIENIIKGLKLIQKHTEGHRVVIDNTTQGWFAIAVYCPDGTYNSEERKVLEKLGWQIVYHEYDDMHYYFTLIGYQSPI